MEGIDGFALYSENDECKMDARLMSKSKVEATARGGERRGQVMGDAICEMI